MFNKNSFPRRKSIVLAVICLLIFTQLMAQNEKVVKEIVINGLRTVDEKEVLGVMTTTVGERSNPRMRADDVAAIMKLGYFSEDVRIYKEDLDDGVRIIVELEENPVVRDIKVVGNSQVKSERIISKLPYKRQDVLPTAPKIKTALAVQRVYALEGYKEADVKVRIDEEEEGLADVTVFVDEGRKILIKDLVIKGNEEYSDWRLKWGLENSGSWLFVRRYFDESAFEDDIDQIRDFYLRRGFLDVKVRRGETEYNEEDGWIRPVIMVEEGPRYEVRDVEAENVTLFTEEEVRDCFDRLIGRHFSADRFRKAMEKLHKLYGDEGYIQMEANLDYRRHSEDDSVTLLLDIDENERIYVGEIKVRRRGPLRGDPETAMEKFYDKVAPPAKDEVILREVTMEPGDVYRSFKEVRSVERLKRLAIFEEAYVTREPTEKKNVRDMVINVKEDVTETVIFGVGYGEKSGAFFQANLRERNLFGDARDLRIRARIGTRYFGAHVGYLDRYFRDTDMSFAFDVYSDYNQYEAYRERLLGASTEFGKPLSEYVRAYLRFRSEYVNFYDEDDDVIEEDFGSYVLGTARFRIEEDRRDDVWWPTKGYVRGAGVEVGYADNPLGKLTADYSWYSNFYKDLIYAVHASAGLMPYDADEVGLTERFYLGGSSDMRGFAYRGAGRKDDGEDDMPLGGSTKLLLKNELRYPIYRDLKGLVFFDAGMLDESVGLSRARISVGTGLRLKLSIFRLYVDFAKALNESDDDDTQIVHFRLGAAL